jgi:hypothetical protein
VSEAVVHNRICPDIAKDDEFYKIRNDYTNTTLRNSFSIEIMKCSKQTSTEKDPCKNDTEIKELLQKIFFTMYTVDSKVSYDNYYYDGDIVRHTDNFNN